MLTTRITNVAAVAANLRAEERLRGTVWEHVPTSTLVYRGFLGIGAAIGRAGISANALTYTSLLLAGMAGVAAATGSFGWAAVLVIISGVFDMLDGAVARATQTVSKWGALLDSTVDRLADALPLLGVAVFYAGHGPALVAPVLALLGGFTTSYVRARAESLGVVLPPLFMRRPERIVLVTLSLLVGLWPLAAPIPAPLLIFGVTVMGVLSFVGSVSALRAARQLMLSPENGRSSAR